VPRILLTVLCVLFLSGNALADGRAFPPDNCSEQTPLMAFTAIQNSNTYCTSGQDIFRNALGNCKAGEQIVYDGGHFICQPAPNTTPPVCGAGQVLTSDGASVTCVDKDAASATTGPSGSWCGMATYYNTGSCANANAGYTSVATCNGQSVVNSCPEGYTRKTVEFSNLTTCGGDGGSCWKYDCMRTCIKN